MDHENLPLAVRGGGHSPVGYGMCDGGVAIDLSQMKRIKVDAGKRELWLARTPIQIFLGRFAVEAATSVW